MRKTKRVLAAALSLAMIASIGLSGCSGSSDNKETTAATEATDAVETTVADTAEETEAVDTDNFIELALHVLYNDADKSCYNDETGSSITVTEEGQYTLTFDCATDLSDETTGVGITSLTNLTAIYIKDEGIAKDEQSPLKAANIMYDSVKVDGTELTITQTEPKSAFKSSGMFDTNDPINSWDGSSVEEVEADSSTHVANFTTVENPTTIEVTFTLSDLDWTGESQNTGDSTDNTDVSTNTYVNTATFSDMDFTDMTSVELTKYLGNGINLGNTMEATLSAYDPTKTSVTSFENAWGQPTTTAEMIQGMKDCGFDTLRIPVAWTNCIDYTNGDYTIREDMLDRIEEIVQYALDAEMFVIINDHWDHGWWAMFGSSDQATADTAWTLYEQMWTQIADRFKDYSDMVIFESANEELGDGLNDNTDCATSGNLTKDEEYELTNQINQKFVDIVRASGGNNTDRFLLIAGFNTNISATCDSRFVMPTDTATSKLFVSVHYYDPWGYCGDKQADTLDDVDTSYARWGVKSDFEYMDTTLGSMKQFTDAGYGVIIGEYGALPVYVNSEGKSVAMENSDVYTAYLLDVCNNYNLCPVLWSTNDSYNKSTLNMITDAYTEVFTSHCYAEEAANADYASFVNDEMASFVEAAPEEFDVGGETADSTEPVAYIMWNGGAGTYNVGDTYTPSDCTAGITPHDVVVDGAGEYTVSLDFAGGNDGLTFAALALNNGEALYPGAILDIKSITYDGVEVSQTAVDYTSSDDGVCTRVNLLNEWVNALPDDARNVEGDLTNASPVILDKTQIVGISNITITFDLVLPE